MNQDYIKQRIAKIRKLISEARHIEAFDDLEAFIIEMDGEEVENARERELLDQLIGIKARFSNFNKKMLQGMQEDNVELNQITTSLLALTASIKSIADENPAAFIPPTLEKKSPTYSANMAIDPDASKTTVGINELSKDGSENSGCLNVLRDDKISNNANTLSKALFRMIIAGLLVLVILFFIAREMGCGKPPPTPPPPPVEKPEKPIDEVTPPLGKTGKELNFPSESMVSEMADHLSNPNTTIPKEFNLDEASFGKNDARLNSAGRKQLDDLTVILKEYGEVNIDIYGFITKDEKSAYKGSKEISLDDVRARSVWEYLKNRGISENRMNFEGGGTKENNNPVIRILNR